MHSVPRQERSRNKSHRRHGLTATSPAGLGHQGRIPETTLQGIRYLRQTIPGCKISVEVEKPNREGLVEMAAEANVVFYSKTWAEVGSVI
jgi:hypothetical protein